MLFKILLLIVLITQNTYAESLYFLCGSDEDGCAEGFEENCACIPVNPMQINQDYFDNMTCYPLSERPHCDPDLIFQKKGGQIEQSAQGLCIAAIFQSGSVCKVVTESFCSLHSVLRCPENGDQTSCN
jgi:hypothetical protein